MFVPFFLGCSGGYPGGCFDCCLSNTDLVCNHCYDEFGQSLLPRYDLDTSFVYRHRFLLRDMKDRLHRPSADKTMGNEGGYLWWYGYRGSP